MENDRRMTRWILATLGGLAVGYCVLVLAIVATTPDLRLRFLLVDADSETVTGAAPVGIRIRQTPDLKCYGPRPREGDLLVSMNGLPIRNFLDFSRAQLALRSRVSPPSLYGETNPLAAGLPPLVQDGQGVRWVRIEYIRPGATERVTGAVKLQSVPSSEIGVTLIWFMLQLLIFAVGAIAFWSRPFDEAARRFFAMCTATLGAFVGGFHWSMIAGSFWLTLPFAISGILLPAVTLHFFLGYPRAKTPLTSWRWIIHTLVYAIPVAAILCFLWVEGFVWSLAAPSQEVPVQLILTWLNYLRYGVYAYLCISAGYFLLTIASLIHSVFTTRNPVELSQVRWILWAGLGAGLCIGYALVLAAVWRIDFALGGARIPMFLASLVFMLAYAIGIIRYKLMLIDQIISKGMWYYVLSYGATAMVSLVIAVGTLAVAVGKMPTVEQPGWIIAGIVMLAVVLLIWLRDSWQHFVDRRFFREKYQLDKALQRMHRDVGRLTDVQFLSERMSISCRDVLQSSRVGLYLGDGRPNGFRLAAADGQSTGLPMQIVLPEEFVQALADDPTLQRAPTSREGMSPVQNLLRQWQADLVHALEMDGKFAGLVVLGPKESGMMYSAEDLTFLTALAQITGIALHCAKVHQDITQLNEDLRLKTDLIGRQRQQITILQAELATVARPDLTTAPADQFRREAIIGHSPALEHIMDTVRKVAASETSVLVRGESGTGKELLAKAIHENSPRHDGPLITVHCAALSAGLLESELFGHVKGAFTGAHSDKPGRFELANGGTLFLDEIGDISPETQIKLLRVLQQREFERVGGTQTIQVDVRLIAATHQNLERLIADGKFREDLYYRLNVISVTLPPLRERFEDILELAVYFLRRAASRAGKRITNFEEGAIDLLTRYTWPGNIRELQNVIERAVVLAEGETITTDDLPLDLQATGIADERPSSVDQAGRDSIHSDNPQAERQALIDALEKCGGNKARAARSLGLARSTYFSKLKKHGLADADGNISHIRRLPR
ncbi:MAG: sigma 54-interacting transcriptional regulator [Planctomycetes bacterium]|nr:sigma 54-interacting transcriptional regulator [Planctomycetota bacterium]